MLMKLFDRTGDCKSAHAGAAHVGAGVDLKKKDQLLFHFSKNMFSFSKCGSTRFRECLFPFSEKHNHKQKFVNK